MEFKQLPVKIQKLYNRRGINAKDMENLYISLKYTTDSLGTAIKELQSWWDDQGDYGTNGYDVLLAEMRVTLTLAHATLKSIES